MDTGLDGLNRTDEISTNSEPDGQDSPLKGSPLSGESPDASEEEHIERMKALTLDLTTDPMAQAAHALAELQTLPHYADVKAIERILCKDLEALKNNDFNGLVAVLNAQALVLNSMFLNQLQKAAQTNLTPEQSKAFIDLALRMQKQSRTTVETIKNLKAPPVPHALIQQNFSKTNELLEDEE